MQANINVKYIFGILIMELTRIIVILTNRNFIHFSDNFLLPDDFSVSFHVHCHKMYSSSSTYAKKLINICRTPSKRIIILQSQTKDRKTR